MASSQRELSPGDVLFREGDRGDEMFVVSTGKIRITKKVNGEDRVLADLASGEFLGEMAILNDEPRTATATALEESVLLVYDKRTFERLLYRNPSIAVRMVYKLAERLRRTDELVAGLR